MFELFVYDINDPLGILVKHHDLLLNLFLRKPTQLALGSRTI